MMDQHNSATDGHLAVGKMLVDAGADISLASRNGKNWQKK